MRSFLTALNELDSQVSDSDISSGDAKLGKVAFGDQRKLGEKNTEHEEKLFDAVREFIASNEDMPDWAVAEISSYLSKGFYKPVFKKPTGGTIYRGMSVTLDWIKEKLGTTKLASNDSSKRRFTFKPHRRVSSWSFDKRASEDFTVSGGRGQVKLVMEALIEENSNVLMLECSEFYDISSMPHRAAEKEVIVFGDLSVNRTSWS